MDLLSSLTKIVSILDREEIEYMIVGGLAMSYYNRYRFTADIDMVLLIHPHHVPDIVKHFPEWSEMSESFEATAKQIGMFNLTDFATGIKYGFLLFDKTDYGWTAYQRKRQVVFGDEVTCYISSPEDLILAKLMWAQSSKSKKQLMDIDFLLENLELDRQYLEGWANRLNLLRHGLF